MQRCSPDTVDNNRNLSGQLRIAVFGSSPISVPVFDALRERFHIVVAVVSDEPHVRRGKAIANPVQSWAEAAGIPVLNGATAGTDRLSAMLHDQAIDILFLLSYGRLLPEALLTVPRLGSLNLHPSPLPWYRGAAPIERQIMDGRTSSAVSIIAMSGHLDRGELLAQESFAIAPTDYRPEVEASIVRVGIPLVLRVIRELACGDAHAIPQRGKGSYAHKLTPVDEVIDWTQPSQTTLNRIRALFPAPGAATFHDGERIRILRAQPCAPPEQTLSCSSEPCGTLLIVERRRAIVRCSDGWLELLQAQFPGKRPMSALDLINGRSLSSGMVFGTDRSHSANT